MSSRQWTHRIEGTTSESWNFVYHVTQFVDVDPLDRLKNHPGYRLRVGDFRVLVDWDRDNEGLYAIDVFERKKESRELGKYREVWGSWRDDQ